MPERRFRSRCACPGSPSVSDAERDLGLVGKTWLALAVGPQRETPALHRLKVPLSEARLALVSTGGFVAPGAEPFNTGKLGDPSFREIPRDLQLDRLEIHHPHYDDTFVKHDINVLFPLPLLKQLAQEGMIGALAGTHYSFMGYVPVTRGLERTFAPELARRLEHNEVQVALFTPA